MDKQLFWIILLVRVYNVNSTENKPVQTHKQMSKEQAKEKCTKTGLANYASVKANPTATGYLNQLLNGESAWIKGYAKLSPFLAWHGCFNTTHKDLKRVGLYAFATEKKSLYLCSQQCLTHKYSYTGMKDRTCYCLKHHQGPLIQYAHVNDSLCSITCENNVVDSCGGHTFVSVYSIVEPGSMHWAGNEPSKRQCVYVKRNRSIFDLHTASCHTFPTNMVNGFICMNSVYSRLETVNCTKANSFCIIDEPSTRQEAYMSCMNRHGKLADLGSESVIPQWMTIKNFKYWIGVYRTFGISERYIENKTICLAAVRVNYTLYLEPDDCSEQKYYLCEQKTTSPSSQYPYITTKTSPINTTTGAISITTPDIGYVSPFAYIIPSILIAIFIVIIVVFVLYRRWKRNIKHQDCVSDDTYTAIYETDNLENEQSQSAISSIKGQNGDSKCLIPKPTPNKSLRQSHKANTEEFTDSKKKKGKEMQDEEYDKINFKQTGHVRKNTYEETNVYNHVLDTTDDNYDTTKAIKSFQSAVPCESDDTYSHMKDGVAMGGYCGLQEAGKNDGDRGKHTRVNYCYSKDIGQKVSSLAADRLPRFVIVDEYQDDMKNESDIEETTQHDDPTCITYTEILNFGAENETDYTCSEKFDKVDRNIIN